MNHQLIRPVTAAVLLAVFAIGCNKRDATPAKAQASRDSAQATPAASPHESSAGEEGSEEGSMPPITGPVSFADGEAAYQAKNYGYAVRLFEHYTTQKPGNAWGHFMLGLSAWKSGDLTKAETAFEKSLSIDPDHVKSLVNLSRVLLEQKRADAAVEKLAHAGDLDPNSNEVHRLLGRAYSEQGNVEGAVDAYRQAIALDEKDVWAMNNLGLLLLEQKRADEAVPLLTKAVELRNDVPAFHNNLGMALEHTGRFSAAATAYSGAVTADPNYEKARKNLARVSVVKENPQEPLEETKLTVDATADSR